MPWLHHQERTNRQTGTREPYFAIAWREEGMQRTMALGFVLEREAERLLTIFQGRLALGEVPPSRRRTARGSRGADQTLSEYLDEVYLPLRKLEVAPSTYASNVNSAKALKVTMGHRRLSEIGYAEAVDHKSRRLATRSGGTVQQELYVLRSALQLAVDTKLLREVQKLPSVKYERVEQDFLSDEEEGRLLTAMLMRPCADPNDNWAYLAVMVGLNTGMRRQEILSRTWEDVQWGDGCLGSIHVSAKPIIGFKTKSRKVRTIPMTPDLRQLLEKVHAARGGPRSGWLFPSPRNAKRPRPTFRYELEQGCVQAGLRRVTPHCLRRTWASRLARQGVSRATLMALGGWRNNEMLDLVYARVTHPEIADVMARCGVSGTSRA